ncbi:MAG: ATP-binding cassette domain-containing protein [Planctomycetaceae bacterium]
MPLLTLNDISIRFRGPLLLDGISSTIEPGQRIGLLGRNGAGKSTLLKMIDGSVQPDTGSIVVAPNTVIRQLRQDVPTGMEGTVHDIVAAGVAGDIDISEQWRAEIEVEDTLAKMKLDGSARFETLSSGMKRRVLLAQGIVCKPDLLLLDEPTNHLDIESILWLEDFLARFPATLIFVTHDRSFLQRVATRIWEIELGKLFDWSCDYETFRKRKADYIAGEEKQQALFDKKLAEEEVWIRQGIKARRTRNEGRVRALEAMRVQRRERQQRVGTAKLKIQEADRSGMLVAEAKNISFAYQGKPIVKDFSTTIMRGDKVGIIGPNGAGKTTLLRLLLGQLEPQQGTIRQGTKLEIAYFDQLRDTLDGEKTVQDNVAYGTDTVKIGDRSKHIIGYLQDFLFTPERARTQVKFLSGGERNRVLLARLMTQPANVIVLDEPTNDLDSETLDLLEEQVVDFGGTVLVVSHDRTFLNNVVTSTIVFEPDGVNEYVGGYDDWKAAAARREPAAEAPPQSGKAKPVAVGGTTAATSSSPVKEKKRSFKEKHELETLPKRIEDLEGEIATLHDAMANPDFFKQSGQVIAGVQSNLQALEKQLSDCYQRWEVLDSQ